MKDRLSVEFNVELDSIADQTSEEESKELAKADEDKLRSDVTKIREKLDNMGPINPMAMEAYTEIKQRNDFIIAQKEDLLKAKGIAFLDDQRNRERSGSQTFLEAFAKIKEHFISVFRSLFTDDDQCDIRTSRHD